MGRAAALALARAGAHIALLDVARQLEYPGYPTGTAAELESLADEAREVGADALVAIADVRDDIAVTEACMKHAGYAVTGLELGIDRKIIHSDRGPRRYTDDRCAATGARTMAMLRGN